MSIKFFSAGKREPNQESISSRTASSETSQAFREHELLLRKAEINRRGKI
ncbi:MAG: hypothetical protein ABSE17_04310 [Candidatus Levyibacteriota bacterium]|jgi:hypothetical protein